MHINFTLKHSICFLHVNNLAQWRIFFFFFIIWTNIIKKGFRCKINSIKYVKVLTLFRSGFPKLGPGGPLSLQSLAPTLIKHTYLWVSTRECLIEENWHWLVASGFWTGCSNTSLSMRGRSRSSAEWMGVYMVFHPPEIHFSQDVIFCQVIWKSHSKGRAKIIHSAENWIFKFTYLF